MGFAVRFVRKWVAGEGFDDAVKRAKKSNSIGMKALIDVLGEHYKRQSQVYSAENDYFYLIRLIKMNSLNADISVKPTNIGLSIGKAECYENLLQIAQEASRAGIFAWIDMESSDYTRDTIDIYIKAFRKFKNIGITIQSNLKRSEPDLKEILSWSGKVRLVKGAYRENSNVAYQGHGEIRNNFSRLMKILFEKGSNFAIATHDKKLIEEAAVLQKRYKKPMEFQFLMGVRDNLKKEMVSRGFAVGEYIPFGKHWFPYFYRRLKERKRNILLIAWSVFSAS